MSELQQREAGQDGQAVVWQEEEAAIPVQQLWLHNGSSEGRVALNGVGVVFGIACALIGVFLLLILMPTTNDAVGAVDTTGWDSTLIAYVKQLPLVYPVLGLIACIVVVFAMGKSKG